MKNITPLAVAALAAAILPAHSEECGRLLHYDETQIVVRSPSGGRVVLTWDQADGPYVWVRVRGSNPPALCWARNEEYVPLPRPRAK